jgi:hypothetical protein
MRKSAWNKSTERKRRQAEANTETCLEGRQLTKCDNTKNFAYPRGMASSQSNDSQEGGGDPQVEESDGNNNKNCCPCIL